LRFIGVSQETIDNTLKNAIHIGNDIVIPKTKDAVALLIQKRSSDVILWGLFSMLATIKFHDQLQFKANEIRHVGSDRLLPAEFISAERPVAKILPQPFFSIRR